MNNYRTNAALKGFGLAIFGYALTLGLGALIGSLFADGDSFADLGIYAVTLVVLAPLGAVAGALIGLKIFGDTNRPKVSWMTGLLIAGILFIMYIGPGMPLGLAGAILALAVIGVYRAGLGSIETREMTAIKA